MLPDIVSVDKDGNRSFSLSINVKEFKPEEIKVRTVGKSIVVSAKTERKVRIYAMNPNLNVLLYKISLF